MEQRPICKQNGLWACLVWFSVPIKVNGKILIPTTHFVRSALFVVVVFATSNCRHITNTKSKNIFHYRKGKLKVLAFQCLIE